MTATMPYADYLNVHPDYRTVTRAPRQCAIVENENGVTVLSPVTITDDYRADFGRTIRFYGHRAYLRVTIRTHSIGTQAPYFSVTAEVWDSRGWYLNGQGGRCRAAGCLHDEIVRAYPDLAPLVALHLADATTGEPMYAFENGWYHYSRGDRDAAARLLRVPENELPADMDEDAFRAYVVAQRARWESEAADGRAMILARKGGNA